MDLFGVESCSRCSEKRERARVESVAALAEFMDARARREKSLCLINLQLKWKTQLSGRRKKHINLCPGKINMLPMPRTCTKLLPGSRKHLIFAHLFCLVSGGIEGKIFTPPMNLFLRGTSNICFNWERYFLSALWCSFERRRHQIETNVSQTFGTEVSSLIHEWMSCEVTRAFRGQNFFALWWINPATDFSQI